jgi:hypothetical protein
VTILDDPSLRAATSSPLIKYSLLSTERNFIIIYSTLVARLYFKLKTTAAELLLLLKFPAEREKLTLLAAVLIKASLIATGAPALCITLDEINGWRESQMSIQVASK